MTIDHAARAEDVRWFVATGESLAGAARRLGLGSDGLEKWLALHGMRDELATLRARDPIPDPVVDRRAISRSNADRRYRSVS